MIGGLHTLADICTIAIADIHRISTRTIINTCAFYSFIHIHIREKGKERGEGFFFFATITHIYIHSILLITLFFLSLQFATMIPFIILYCLLCLPAYVLTAEGM